MGFKYILAVFIMTAFFVTGCSSGADNSGKYFDENGEVIDKTEDKTEFDPTYGYGLESDGEILKDDAENMAKDAGDAVRDMGDSIKDTVDDMTDGSGRNTVEGTNPASDGYTSPEMTGVNGAGDYRNTTGMAGTANTARDY